MTTGQAGDDGTVTTAASRIPPPDEAAYLDGRLMAELSALNYLLGQYVLRYHDADAGRVEPIPLADERALARSVTAAAEAIRARATRRECQEGEGR